MDEGQTKSVDKLLKACQDAFYRYPNSCSHAVWHVIRQYNQDQPYMIANDLVDFLASSIRWREVQVSELSGIASAGGVIIGGLKEQGHGHVVVVYPGQEKTDGGYQFVDKAGKLRKTSETGIYALAMSTSMGNWPGARSNGDKTVRDPWPAKVQKCQILEIYRPYRQSIPLCLIGETGNFH